MLKRSLFIIYVVAVGIILSVGRGYAQDESAASDKHQKKSYMIMKGGMFYPRGDLDGLDDGFNGEIAYGYRFHPNIAVELGSGYLKASGTGRAIVGGVDVKVEDEIYAIPATVAIKGTARLKKNMEIYALAGIGAYFVDFKETVSAGGRSLSMSDSSVVPGVFVGTGISYDINDKFFLGFEGKYIFTDDVELKDRLAGVGDVHANFNVEGFTGTVNIGVRF